MLSRLLNIDAFADADVFVHMLKCLANLLYVFRAMGLRFCTSVDHTALLDNRSLMPPDDVSE